jgi:hypothetical protein
MKNKLVDCKVGGMWNTKIRTECNTFSYLKKNWFGCKHGHKRTKAMDMRFHWLRDRQCQEQFRIYLRLGKSNYADYWTNHHPATHHKHTRKEFITPHIVEMLRLEQSRVATAAAA